GGLVDRLHRLRWIVVPAYIVTAAALLAILLPRVGTEIFPRIDTRQLQVRLRAPTGTRLERTEIIALKATDAIKALGGPQNVEIPTAFVGVTPPSYPINAIHLFTSGQHEAVLGVALKPSAAAVSEPVKEAIRRELKRELPDVAVSFEAADIISRVMSFG